ncbi:MAG: AraC family transcriptional regulator [Planctomycetota bacterium]|nr:AraC family transcriptional regulator [Planctomycetota bacterium]
MLDIGAPANLIREFRKLQARLAVPEREAPSRLVLVEVLQFLNGLWDRARARSSEDEARKRIHEACRMLEQSADGREPLEEIARDLGLSYATFRKHFREELGVSPGTYRIRQRIQRACRLLPQHSVKCVAAELGYPDPFTFSSQFKAAMGVSPQGFQKRLREGGHE